MGIFSKQPTLPPIYAQLASLIPQSPTPVIIECGCHVGVDTQRLRDTFPTARLIAVEPDPRNLIHLSSRGVTSIAEVLPMAVSDRDGSATFHLSEADLSTDHPSWVKSREYSGSSSLKRPAEHTAQHPWCVFEKSVEVPTITLDTLARERSLDRIDLIWADVQGAEDLLIAGGQTALARTRYLYTEFSDTEVYQGQIPLAKILERLPGGPSAWSIVEKFPYDVLLRNDRLSATAR
jgi:FkbM family methyltransferase